MSTILTAITGFFTSLWSRYQAILIYITAAIAAVVTIFYKGKAAGRLEAEANQREANDEARKRMEAVKPADIGSTVDSLREGDF